MCSFGTVLFCHDGGRWVSGGDVGATHDLAQRGVCESGWESVMAMDRFCRNDVGPPKWECEAMGSVVWVKCATSTECVIKSIDSRVLGHGHGFVLGPTVSSALS